MRERRITVATRMDADPPIASLADRTADAAATMRRHGAETVVVIDNTRSLTVQGVLTARQIVFEHVAVDHPRECRVREHAARLRSRTVTPDTDFDAACDAMRADGVQALPVVDANGRLLGLVALPTSDTPADNALETVR
jgi:CBS domain-containing protein